MKKLIVLLIGLVLVLGSAGISGADVLFEHDFDSGNLNDFTQIPNAASVTVGNWTMQDGVLQCDYDPSTGAGSYLRLDAIAPAPESYAIEFDARMVVPQQAPSASSTGVHMNFFDWNNHIGHDYRQGSGYNHLILVERINGQYQSGDAPYPEYLHMVAFDPDETQWHHLKHVKDGTSFSFFFDHQLIYTYELPIAITDGYFVLRTSPGTNQIDDLLVMTLEPPEPPPVPIDLDLTEFFIKKDKKTGTTTTAMFGLFIQDLPELVVSDGDSVQCRITIELFDVLENEGDVVISNDSELTVNEHGKFFVIRK